MFIVLAELIRYVIYTQIQVKTRIDLILENWVDVNLLKDIELIGHGGKILDVGSRGQCASVRLKLDHHYHYHYHQH